MSDEYLRSLFEILSADPADVARAANELSISADEVDEGMAAFAAAIRSVGEGE